MRKTLFVTFCLYLLIILPACSSIRSSKQSSVASFSKMDKLDKQQAAPIKHKYTYRVRGEHYKVLDNAHNFTQLGMASWYGKAFHGKKTASGERFNMHALTAAHRVLPLGSKVLVTNLANGNTVVLRINDRGPFHNDRVIDVSKKAAKKLGFIKQGKTKVKIKVIQ